VTIVTGHVPGFAGAEVVLFGPGERPALLATGITDGAGAFALEADEAAGSATVLVKLKDDVVGVLARELPLPTPAPVELRPGPSFALSGAIENGDGELVLALEPARPEGVPERLWPFINQRAEGVFAGRYLTRPLAGPAFSVRVLAGTWRVGAEFIDHDRPNMPTPDFHNYVTAAARSEPDGMELAGTEYGGYEIDVHGDRQVTLTLREVDDAEL
jgi:hypothetical protein